MSSNIVKKYTQFINFPIELKETKDIYDDDGESKIVTEWTYINNKSPIWCRSVDEVT